MKVKKDSIIQRIKDGTDEINANFGRGSPDFFFYNRVINERKKHETIDNFLACKYCLELLYATLLAWGMNPYSSYIYGSKMKSFEDFCYNITKHCQPHLTNIECTYHRISNRNNIYNELNDDLKVCFEKMNVMNTSKTLVSNSKILHFLFYDLLMPMDNEYTLRYFYDKAIDSIDTYMEVLKVSFDIRCEITDWDSRRDDKWNVSIPKIIDNAIILLRKEPREEEKKIKNEKRSRKREAELQKAFEDGVAKGRWDAQNNSEYRLE